MSIRNALLLGAAAVSLILSACAADPGAAPETNDDNEIKQATLQGTWRFSAGSKGSASLSGIEIKSDGTYVGEVMQACANGEPGETMGCRGVGIHGTWAFAPFIHEITPWGTLTLHGATHRYEQPGNVERPMDLVLRLSQSSGKEELKVDEAGDHSAIAFAFGGAPIHATLTKDKGSTGFCASSKDCEKVDMFHVELACDGRYKKTCTADRTCAFPCVTDGVAGYGDGCGLLPSQQTHTTCFAAPGARHGIRCLDNMAGNVGSCVATDSAGAPR